MLTRWNDYGSLGRFGVFDTFDALRREMNRLFYDFEHELPNAEPAARNWPRAWLEDNGGALLLRVELPGVDDKDIELSVDGSTASVKGERKDPVPEGYSVHRKERGAFRFARSFRLPTKVDPEAVRAELKHGILNVTLPKAKEVQPRQINVRAEG